MPFIKDRFNNTHETIARIECKLTDAISLNQIHLLLQHEFPVKNLIILETSKISINPKDILSVGP